MNTFAAVVKAPQGGPIYVHEFEGASVAEVLRRIADGTDLDAAERVDIVIVPGYRADEAGPQKVEVNWCGYGTEEGCGYVCNEGTAYCHHCGRSPVEKVLITPTEGKIDGRR